MIGLLVFHFIYSCTSREYFVVLSFLTTSSPNLATVTFIICLLKGVNSDDYHDIDTNDTDEDNDDDDN